MLSMKELLILQPWVAYCGPILGKMFMQKIIEASKFYHLHFKTMQDFFFT